MVWSGLTIAEVATEAGILTSAELRSVHSNDTDKETEEHEKQYWKLHLLRVSSILRSVNLLLHRQFYRDNVAGWGSSLLIDLEME